MGSGEATAEGDVGFRETDSVGRPGMIGLVGCDMARSVEGGGNRHS